MMIVTIRERRAKVTASSTIQYRWEIVGRFDSPDAKVACDKAFEVLNGNPQFSITIMRKSEDGTYEGA